MKKTFTLLTWALITISSYAQIQTPDLFYYRFEETGTTVTNEALTPPPGTATATILGGVTQGAGAICNGSLIGSGVSSTTDYLNTGWTTNLTGLSWTISFRTANFGSTAALYYIFGDATAGGFRCFTNGVAGANNWILRGPVGDITIAGGATAAPHMNTFVYDAIAGQIKGYLDGVLVATISQTAPTITGTGPFKVMGYSSNIGAPAGGNLDEFRLYGYALTDAQVLELYQSNYSGFLGADQFICPGDTTALVTGLSADSVLWSTGSGNDTLWVQTADTFHVTISGQCANGSDTIVLTSLVTTDSISAVTCDTLYTAPSGNTFSTSGIYTDTIPNAAGCDSLITITLTMNSNTSSTISPNECGSSYNSPSGNIYTISGTYNDTIPNFIGCDSVITINLNFLTVTTGVTQSGVDGEDLSANASSATYQWVNCPSYTAIGGATSQNFTAPSDGQYAVIVTENGCSDTSACFTVAGLGISMDQIKNNLNIYPNPGNGVVTINWEVELTGSVTITNAVGQMVYSKELVSAQQLNIELNTTPGIYFITLRNEVGEKTTINYILQ